MLAQTNLYLFCNFARVVKRDQLISTKYDGSVLMNVSSLREKRKLLLARGKFDLDTLPRGYSHKKSTILLSADNFRADNTH